MKPITMLSLFSGIGFQEMSIPFKHQLVNYCEANKKLSKCFSALHNISEDKNLGDVRFINYEKLPKQIDIMISTFPCQSFSIAGKKLGVEDEKNGDMINYNLNIIEYTNPKVIIFENVKNILNKKFNVVPQLKNILDRLGYDCYDKILNSKDYGIPQSRDRWFMVCVKSNINPNPFIFPPKIPLTQNVSNYLYDEISRKCDTSMKPFLNSKYCDYNRYVSKDIHKLFDGVGEGYFKSGFTSHRIYSIYGCCPTQTTINDCHFFEIKGKLTPKERFLLMGGNLKEYEKIKKYLSEREIEKICGNGVVVNVMKQLLSNVYEQYFKM
jgi:DNA (cytosine-5)-methyltransferase 1